MTSRRIETAYTTPSATTALGGAKRLLAAKLAPDERVREWLRGQEAYTLHKAAPKRFARRPTVVAGPHEQIQADLMDVRSHKDANDGTTFLLTAVDVFSKVGWAIPLRTKTGREVSNALRGLFAGYRVRAFQTDKGKEFLNKDVEAVLRDANVKSFVSQDDVVKASIVERFNKTLRAKIHRYLTYTGGSRFIDVLPDIVDAYNRSTHASTGMAPRAVGPSNMEAVWQTLYGEPELAVASPPKLSPGDYVKLSTRGLAFERGYTPNWSIETFKVRDVRRGERPVVYVVEDLNGDAIEGTFYEKQLQRVSLPETFRVERVIRSRTRRGVREHYVRWLGYPDSPAFNSWVADADMT